MSIADWGDWGIVDWVIVDFGISQSSDPPIDNSEGYAVGGRCVWGILFIS
jgi:hypothetical protein